MKKGMNHPPVASDTNYGKLEKKYSEKDRQKTVNGTQIGDGTYVSYKANEENYTKPSGMDSDGSGKGFFGVNRSGMTAKK